MLKWIVAKTSRVELFININLLALNVFSWRIWRTQVTRSFFVISHSVLLVLTVLYQWFFFGRKGHLVDLEWGGSNFLLGDSVSIRWRVSHQPWQSGEVFCNLNCSSVSIFDRQREALCHCDSGVLSFPCVCDATGDVYVWISLSCRIEKTSELYGHHFVTLWSAATLQCSINVELLNIWTWNQAESQRKLDLQGYYIHWTSDCPRIKKIC